MSPEDAAASDFDAAADSYGSWWQGISSAREIKIRRGELPPLASRPWEQKWADDGLNVEQLDTVKGEVVGG